MSADLLFEDAKKILIRDGVVRYSVLQRELNVTMHRANKLVTQLQDAGLAGREWVPLRGFPLIEKHQAV